MKNIGISQRVVFDEMSGEVRDVLDQRWYNFSIKTNLRLFPIPNKLIETSQYLKILSLDGLILSGGNNVGSQNKVLFKDKTLINDDVSLERESTEIKLLDWALKNNKPVLGVCKGMQFINSYFKGSQVKLDGLTHVNKKHKINFIDNEFIEFYGKKNYVNSYHNFGIQKNELSNQLIPTGYFDDIVESSRHINKRIYGIMWHPERNNPFDCSDLKLIKNIFKYDE